MSKQKKILLIGGIIEGAILLFALILSIIVWTTIAKGPFNSTAEMHAANIAKNREFIAFFQNNTPAFFAIVCVPVFIIVAVDFVYFAIVASKRETNLTDKQLAAIKKRAEEEVRAEMMKEIEAEALGEIKKEEKSE